MVTDFPKVFAVLFFMKFATKSNPCRISCQILTVLLHYLAKCKRTKLAKFCCT